MFFQQATKGRNDFWIYLMTVFLVILAYFLGQAPMLYFIAYKIRNNPDFDDSMVDEFMANPDFSIFEISKNLGLVLLLLMFITAFLMLLALVKNLHKKNIMQLINPLRVMDWKKVFFGFGVWFAIMAIFEIAFYFMDPSSYTFSFNWDSFLVLLLISLFLLPIQTSFEELFFRGYLLQGISLASDNKWIPLIITSILFGLIHAFNPEIEKYGFWTMEMYYLSAGLILGIMTIMDDCLELALGVHFATNFFASTMMGYEGAALQTDTLFTTSEVNPFMMFISMAVGGVVFLFIASKKYKWKSFKYILEPIEFEENEINDATLT
jgi:membrane protease YdiL (CAAX protease family)